MEPIVFDESSSDGSSSPDNSWIACFVNQPGYELLAQVPREFIAQRSNLTNLHTAVDDYQACLMTILDLDTLHMEESMLSPPPYTNLAKLFALIHVRYINSVEGINHMAVRYNCGEFGFCPRIYCGKQKALPIGLSDQFGINFVKMYCPRCSDIFQPVERSSNLDGAYFGTSFPHMFFMTLPDLRPKPLTASYIPRLYGFQIAKSAYEPLPEPSIRLGNETIDPKQMLPDCKNPDGKDGAQ